MSKIIVIHKQFYRASLISITSEFHKNPILPPKFQFYREITENTKFSPKWLTNLQSQFYPEITESQNYSKSQLCPLNPQNYNFALLLTEVHILPLQSFSKITTYPNDKNTLDH